MNKEYSTQFRDSPPKNNVQDLKTIFIIFLFFRSYFIHIFLFFFSEQDVYIDFQLNKTGYLLGVMPK